MPSIKDLKRRIGSVKNTQQTTKAMKMVSAAKLRRAQEAIQAQRPFAKKNQELIRKVAAIQGESFESPLLSRERSTEKPKLLVVVVTSDRGLCGGFNSNIIKYAARFASSETGAYESVTLSYVGRKGHEFFKTKRYQHGHYFSEAGGKVTFSKAKKLSEELVVLYLSGQFDEVKFIYNEFKNAVSQQVVLEDYLPIQPVSADAGSEPGATVLVKPTAKEVLEYLIEKTFAIQAFRILLESQAGEHGARMSAMENATKNASEMIRKLTLQYNKQRQAGITKELLEIISGSESQKSS